MKEFVARCREWQKQNSEYELICDIPDVNIYYVQWSELPRAERMSWIGSYRRCAKDAFEEFGTKRCKVECSVLDKDMVLHNAMDWPAGEAMMVFRTKRTLVNVPGCTP